jgi:hypothetical protein
MIRDAASVPYPLATRILGVVAVLSIGAIGACSRPARESTPNGVAAASPSVTVAPSVPATSGSAVPIEPAAPACGDAGDTFVFMSPERAVRGKALRVVALTERAVDASLVLYPANGTPVTAPERHGGPPYFWIARIDAPRAGKWNATLVRDDVCGGATLATKAIVVRASALPVPESPRTALWFTRAAWSPSLENVYSAWIESMFEAPLDAQPSWPALHDVLRDQSRNFLFNHLGATEDEKGVVIRPDCADLPYFLRAYFAYKLGLPFGWSRCTRGENGVAPVCTDFATSSDPFPPVDGQPQTLPLWADPDRERPGPWNDNAKRLGELFRTTLADWVQSGAGRTSATDDESDYYPVSLSVDTLRPGTIFADPYGHVLVVAQRIAQTPRSGGVLLAVDGQPDGTVARKRFWRGNFLFAIDPALGSAGFKRFRPLTRDSGTGKLRRLKNAELDDYSASDQYAGGVDGFYDKMDDVLSPAPLDPMQALIETIVALEEQVRTRVLSVDNGRKFLASGKPPADMPDGAKIFETTGDWEDFSTPSRDLRLLIAIDVARALPARVARRPNRYAMPSNKAIDQVRAELDARLAQELRARSVEYTRTDGSTWKLTLADVIDRAAALEMAYNPNECVEERWGAPAGSQEAATCGAHAPEAQTTKMLEYRAWFHERRRPPR